MWRGQLIYSFLSIALIVNSCSMATDGDFHRPVSVGLPTSEEQQEIRSGKKAIVLLRVAMLVGKKSVVSPSDRLEFGLGSIYSPNLFPVIPKVPSEEAKDESWIYFVLNPGRYNLWILPPDSNPKQFRFQIDVPSGTPMVYAGSLTITCNKSGPNRCSEPVLKEEAPAVFSQVFPANFGRTEIVLMRRYTPPSNDTNRDLFPMAVGGFGSTTQPTKDNVVGPSALPETSRAENVVGEAAAATLAGPAIILAVMPTLVSLSPFLLPAAVAGLGILVVGAKATQGIRSVSEDQKREMTCVEKASVDLQQCQSRILEELAGLQSSPNYLSPFVDGLKMHGAVQLIELSPNDDLFSKARVQGFRTLLQTGVTASSLSITEECSACVSTALVVRLWDVREGTLLYDKTFLRRCDEKTNRLTAFPNATLPFGAYDDSRVIDDQSTDHFQSVTSVCDFPRSVLALAFSPDGKLVATAGKDGVILWDVEKRRPAGELLEGREGYVNSVVFSPDGRLLAAGGADNSITLWDTATQTRIGEQLKGHKSRVNSVAWSPDGRLLASCSFDGTVVLWDMATQSEIGEPLKGREGSCDSVAFSPDGALLASGIGNTVTFWDVATRTQAGTALTTEEWVESLAFSPDGRLLVSGIGSKVIMWDVVERRQVGEVLGDKNRVTSVAFSPDGRLVASGRFDGTVMVGDALTRRQIGTLLNGHSGIVFSVAFSPDGSLLASGGFDGKVMLWDVKQGVRAGELSEPHPLKRISMTMLEQATKTVQTDFFTKIHHDRNQPR